MTAWLILALAQVITTAGDRDWSWTVDGARITRAEMESACCTGQCPPGRLTCGQIFALPDDRLPLGCAHAGSHIVCR